VIYGNYGHWIRLGRNEYNYNQDLLFTFLKDDIVQGNFLPSVIFPGDLEDINKSSSFLGSFPTNTEETSIHKKLDC
jgi:hypothetical protein